MPKLTTEEKTIRQKEATMKWRNNNRDQYKLYLRDYNHLYVMKNKEKENLRFKKHRQYVKECARMRDILVCF